MSALPSGALIGRRTGPGAKLAGGTSQWRLAHSWLGSICPCWASIGEIGRCIVALWMPSPGEMTGALLLSSET